MNALVKRSDCPISYSLDVFGDKWSLLILRDLVFAGKSSYGQFQQSDEQIATNILADRLAHLASEGIVHKLVSPVNRSRFVYCLTEKGIDLIPLLLELIVWGAKYSPDGGNEELLRQLSKDRKGTIKGLATIVKKRMNEPLLSK
jgi:DNA-binding HxlR family transcriptional regulator